MSLVKKPKHSGAQFATDSKSVSKSDNAATTSCNPLSDHVAHAHPLSRFVAGAHPLSKYVSSSGKKVRSLAESHDKFTSHTNLDKYTKLADPPDKHSPRFKLQDSSAPRINPLDNNDAEDAFARAAPLGTARSRYNPVE